MQSQTELVLAAYSLGEIISFREDIAPEVAVAVPALINSLNDEDPDVRILAVYALFASWQIIRYSSEMEPEAEAALISSLNDEDPNVRILAIYALGLIAPPSEAVIEALGKIYRDSSQVQEVRFAAGLALFLSTYSRAAADGPELESALVPPRPILCQLPGIQNILPRCR